MINILLSTYNGEKYILDQLNSLMWQEYREFMLYIRDDGSTDETVSLIQNWIGNTNNEKNVKLICGKNIGFVNSFMELLKVADKGDYWAFCDQDDIWLPNKLKFSYEMLQNTDNNIPIMYHGSFDLIDASGKQIGQYILNPNRYVFRQSLTCSICYGFSIVINANLREKLLFSDCSKIQSHDWYAAMIASAFGSILFDERIVAKHRIHQCNVSSNDLMQKIKIGLNMFSGESFYTKNIREFMRCFGHQCNEEQLKLLQRFLLYRYRITDAVYKALYPGRWNYNVLVDIILRCLMLIGKV